MYFGNLSMKTNNLWNCLYLNSAIARIVSIPCLSSRISASKKLTMLDFSMPSLNSIFPFLEAGCPKSDFCWQIRRGQLLHHYEPFWAVYHSPKDQASSLSFSWEVQLESVEIYESTFFMLCLVPKSWIQTSGANCDSQSKVRGLGDKLRQACLHLGSSGGCVSVIELDNFMCIDEGKFL